MKLRTAVATIALGLTGIGGAHAASLTYTFSADNAYSVYISSNDSMLGTPVSSTLGGGASQWNDPGPTTTITLNGPVEYLQVIVYNYTSSNGLWTTPETGPTGNNPVGLIGTLSITGGVFPNGATSISTDTVNWLSAQIKVPTPDNVALVNWVPPDSAPQSYGTNGISPWNTLGNGISPSAEWIWSSADPNNYEYADFSIEITSTPLPAAWSMMLIGLAALGFVGYRKKSAVLAAA